MLTKTTFVSAIAICVHLTSVAETAPEPDAVQDTIIIEGSRLNQTQTEIGSSVSVVTADEIEALGVDFAIDAIATVPGVTVNQNSSFGGIASVRIRGAATAQTLFLIDGVPVNDVSESSASFNFARVDSENIERIEVLKGPQSTLWGSDAIGGVVSIITKDPEPGFSGAAFLEYGSFNTVRGGASIGQSTDVGDFRLAATTISTDGISKADENNGNSEDDAYDALTISAKGGLNLGEARLAADVLWSDADYEYDVFTFGAPGNVGDGDAENETEDLTANISLTAPLFDGRLENLFLIGYAEIDRQNFQNGSFFFGGDGDRTNYRYQGTLTVSETSTLAFGAERDETRTSGTETSTDGLFALYEFQPAQGLTLTGGLRIDDHSTFGTETTGRVAAAYNPSPQITLRASWGQGFKAPTINQITGGCCAAPNPDLQPETSEAFDVGIDWRSRDGKAAASLTVFDMDIENLIQFASSGYFNDPETESQGVEVEGRYDLNDWVSVSAGYTYIDAIDTNGEPALRIPEHAGDVRVTLDPEGPFSGTVLVRYTDVKPDRGGTKVDDWVRVDLSGSYDLNDQVELFGRIENLFDEEYQHIVGYGTPDLSGSIGIRLRY